MDIEVIERHDVVVVVVDGELDLNACPALERSLVQAAATEAPAIVLDLDRVSFMDCAGLHVLLDFSSSELGRGRLALTRGSRPVQRLLALTGAGRRLSFVSESELSAG